VEKVRVAFVDSLKITRQVNCPLSTCCNFAPNFVSDFRGVDKFFKILASLASKSEFSLTRKQLVI
jgi:hypothetical protein